MNDNRSDPRHDSQKDPGHICEGFAGSKSPLVLSRERILVLLQRFILCLSEQPSGINQAPYRNLCPHRARIFGLAEELVLELSRVVTHFLESVNYLRRSARRVTIRITFRF